MHEMMKYFLFTEIHEQCLNQLSAPSWESSICRRIDRVTIPSESSLGAWKRPRNRTTISIESSDPLSIIEGFGAMDF